MFGQDGPYAGRPGLDRVGIGYGGLLHLTGYPDRPPVRVGVTISDYLTGHLRGPGRRRARCTHATHAAASGVVIDAALYGAALRILEWTLAAYDRLGVVRTREGNRLANSAPLDNYPTRDGKYVCIVAGSDTNFARLCEAMERPDLVDDPRFAKLADARRAQRRDQRHRRRVDRHARRDRDRSALRRAATYRSRPRTPRPTSSPTRTSRHRRDLVTVDDPVIGAVRQQAPFPRVVGETPAPPAGAPRARRAHARGVRRARALRRRARRPRHRGVV